MKSFQNGVILFRFSCHNKNTKKQASRVYKLLICWIKMTNYQISQIIAQMSLSGHNTFIQRNNSIQILDAFALNKHILIILCKIQKREKHKVICLFNIHNKKNTKSGSCSITRSIWGQKKLEKHGSSSAITGYQSRK